MRSVATTPNVFIIESLGFEDEDDGRTEGQFLAHILKLADRKVRYFYIRTLAENTQDPSQNGPASRWRCSVKTLEEILQFARAERRVCPRPQKWAELFELISGDPHAPRIPPPLILAAWWHTSDEDKRERLALHIRLASDAGKLPQVAAFLSALPPDEWVSEGEAG